MENYVKNFDSYSNINEALNSQNIDALKNFLWKVKKEYYKFVDVIGENTQPDGMRITNITNEICNAFNDILYEDIMAAAKKFDK